MVAACEKRLFRFFLSKIFLNKERIFPLVFYARSLLPESSLTIYGSLRARKIGFFIQSQPGTLFRQIKLARIEDSRLPFRLHHFFVNEVRRHSSYYYDFQKELPYLGNGVCWFGIVGWVDVTDDESFFFSTSVTLSLLVPYINNWWIKNKLSIGIFYYPRIWKLR